MKRILIIFFLMIYSLAALPAEETLILPTSPDRSSPVNAYLAELLVQSLAKTGLSVDIAYHPQPMNSKRLIASLADNKDITLIWQPETLSHPNLVAVPFPLYKGLHGKRLLLIHKDNLARFADINTLAQLQQLTAAQNQSWSDYDILRFNGLKVDGTLAYQGMYKALEEKLIDYFPRSARTIQAELAKQNNPNLVIEPHLMLSYPNTYVFFLNKKNAALAERLKKGLAALKKSGEFDALYARFMSAHLKDLALEGRIEIMLALPEATKR